MGGNAFQTLLPDAIFPRISPILYHALKSRLKPCLQKLFVHVAVPPEAPEKTGHGDLDFVVADAYGEGMDNDGISMSHTTVMRAIGATAVVPMPGNRTSNFAIPIPTSERTALSYPDSKELFYQVDVRVCADEAEWRRIVFFHGYGDLGRILGTIVARGSGFALSLGEKGLKMPDPPNPPLVLSDSFDEILSFLGLDMRVWEAGFATNEAIFEWVAGARFFHAAYALAGEAAHGMKREREMHIAFTRWAIPRAVTHAPPVVEDVIAEALAYFGKGDRRAADIHARHEQVRVHNVRARVKALFRASTVRDWAGLGEYWRGVKMIMDEVRRRVGGEEGVARIAEAEGEAGLRKLVVEVRDDLGLAGGGARSVSMTTLEDPTAPSPLDTTPLLAN